MANWIAPQHVNFYKYSVVALAIRGIYWWALALLPLVLFSYLAVLPFIITVLLLGIGFPLSVIIGAKTAEMFGFSIGFFAMHGTWEHAEVWYGLMQDIVLFTLLLIVIL